SGKIEQLFTIGGDGEADKSGSKAQRFKPIVKVLGPFTLKSGSNTHKITLPQYIGSVRVMVVAGNNGAFGNAEKAVPVRKPLMVQATLPRVVGPGEEVDLPVTIFAMEKSIKNFKVEVKPNNMFHMLDSRSKQVQVNEVGEYDLSFRLKVASNTGIGRVKIVAQSGYLKSEYDVEIDVRNPNPKITKYFETTIEAGSIADINYEVIGIPGTNKANLEVSSIPPVDLSRRLGYLLSYPYGCAEQTTSGAFPQLYLDKFIELDADARKQRDNNIIAAIKRINSMMLSDGGIGYWPGTSYVNPWATCYAGHFMIEAEKHGFTLPSGFTTSWVRYQKREARSWAANASAPAWERLHEELTQAYRLYTLALASEPETGAMNRMKEIRGLSVPAAWRLAAAYALIGQNAVAKQIITSAGSEIKDYMAFNPTFGSVERDWAMMLETLSLLKDKTAAFTWMKKVAAALSKDDWMSTQSTAYCLIGISKFIEMSGGTAAEMRYSYSNTNAKGVNVSTHLPVSKINLGAKPIGTYSARINNMGKGLLFARVVTEGIPETGPQTAFENNMRMSLEFKKQRWRFH
ncbi:MAG TPA: alpha-2-macroglobulin family protein, partial [Bacteroidales bacterium]|nr:alpha-2-macroglobulin family protein [Bacteroidales bacterium]